MFYKQNIFYKVFFIPFYHMKYACHNYETECRRNHTITTTTSNVFNFLSFFFCPHCTYIIRYLWHSVNLFLFHVTQNSLSSITVSFRSVFRSDESMIRQTAHKRKYLLLFIFRDALLPPIETKSDKIFSITFFTTTQLISTHCHLIKPDIECFEAYRLLRCTFYWITNAPEDIHK